MFKLRDRSSSTDSQLSQLKSPDDGVCQLEASPGMSGQPEARSLQWGPGGENSLIKFCLASPRLGPLHPHANNLDTLAKAKSGHLCATSASQKTSATFYNCSQSTQSLPLGSNLQNLSLFCQLKQASRIFLLAYRTTQGFSQNYVLRCHFS